MRVKLEDIRSRSRDESRGSPFGIKGPPPGLVRRDSGPTAEDVIRQFWMDRELHVYQVVLRLLVQHLESHRELPLEDASVLREMREVSA